MSSHSENVFEMCCAEFEKIFDRYVDDMLDEAEAASADRHVATCPACDLEVTRWQQTRVLLSTAVADFATAVDVSGLRRDVEAALGFAEATAVPAAPAMPRRHDRAATREGARGPARRSAAASGRGRLASAVRLFSAASASAAVAAAAVFLLAPAPQDSTSVVASLPAVELPESNVRTVALRPRGWVPGAETAAVAYTPPPLAKPDTSHVDGLETSPGHLVSTWVQPRTNARVIWVDDAAMGVPVRTAGYDR